MTDNEKIARWDLVKDSFDRMIPDYANDIALWRGLGGLLLRIEQRGMWSSFYSAWIEAHPLDRDAAHIEQILDKANPTELTAALVKVIAQ